MKRIGRSPGGTRMRRSATATKTGFSLVEVLFALIGMGVAMIGLAGMLLVAARTATQVSTRSARGAEQTEQLNYLTVLPYAELDSQAGCTRVEAVSFPHTRCITVTTLAGSGTKEIQVIIQPLYSTIKPDTTYLTRSIGKQGNPLGT
ncbi:MAG TPA: hypothetical protein VJ717_15525 [Gemmatimonadaceae bacterium]|nr:hypothetical protein [Gemmatimonadaceae bacterium]